MAITALEIKNKLLTDNRWLLRGVLAIYARQTAEEHVAEDTIVSNRIGFNSTDGKALSEMAGLILAGKTLTPKQLAETRRRMLKYANQLRDIAKERATNG